jgi:hypothetical protein
MSETELSIDEVLDVAADLIQVTGWVRGELAQNVYGIAVHPLADDAACYCVRGAIVAVTGNLDLSAAEWFLRDNVLNENVPAWNDNVARTADEALAALREGAQRYREQSQRPL